jgi:hypothetical protein
MGAIGFVAGGAWNMASLWSLQRMLHAWLGPLPSRGRALLWLLVKFPLLYLLGLAMLHSPQVSPLGFGIGFTLVFLIGGGLALRANASRRAHGR